MKQPEWSRCQMAKMFYTVEEVAEKLGTSTDDVMQMAQTGQIQEFRDRDKIMFKVDQIDLLAGDGDDAEDSTEIPLALEDSRVDESALGLQGSSIIGDSSEQSSLDLAGSQTDEESLGDGTKAGAFDDELSLETVGSGSGLLDLTRESDDTSLGAELLEDVMSSDAEMDIPANASGLFDAAGVDSSGNIESQPAGIATMPMMVESYDGSWSGLGVGLMIGALISLILSGWIALVALSGVAPGIAETISGSFWMWCGGLFGLTIIFGLVGFFIGKASE
ncbi:MAG: hypothetical protein CMJ32_02835 [Phycisphaerae bacterium]|nr:hypothetical protein [Phycisphaerae bacterium]